MRLRDRRPRIFVSAFAAVLVAAVLVAAVLVAAVLVPGQALAQTSKAGPAYLLIEWPSKRVVARSRPDVLDTPIAPGSVLKIATLIAAADDGVVTPDTRIACRRTIVVDGKTLTCVHPDLHRPLSASEALGYSCNVFFATVAERVRRTSLDAVLVRLGLGPLSPAAPTASGALGLAGIRATPRALLDAFVRVASGDRGVRMAASTRAMLTDGLRLAAASGTASAFGESGIRALAKTGTAPMPGGGYHGIVVAMAPDSAPTHAIVAVVPGGAGADAARVAADAMTAAGIGTETVRVGVARPAGGYDIVPVPLEQYVSRVVNGELGGRAPPAALEAMGMTVRTFARAHRGRHAADGFDLCDLTHCQVMGRATAATDAAVAATTGLVLLDGLRIADVYYSAWCGGYTQTPSRAWPGAADRTYLPSRPDEACASEAAWTSEIPEPRLRQALQAAGLKGEHLTSLAVTARDASGRAQTLRATGMTPESLSANLFQLAAGRVLGWQVVKSTRFEIRQTATGVSLTGRGLGHGVGLCARGTLNRAGGGATRQDILAAYFPGVTIGRMGPAIVRVQLPEADARFRRDVHDAAERALTRMAAKLGMPAGGPVTVRVHPTVEAYARSTGQPWWTAARTAGTAIDLIPLTALRDRGTLEPTLAHEMVHVLAGPMLADRPLWVREGLAVVLAGELAATGPSSSAPCPADDALQSARTAVAWRSAYQAAGQCVARALAAGRRWQELK
jgi:stage II sporulation protein D